MSITLYSLMALLVTTLTLQHAVAQKKDAEKEDSPFSSKAYEKFSWGARIGPSLTFVHFSDRDAGKSMNSLPALGFIATGLVQFKLGNHYVFVTEAGYSFKSSRFTFSDGNAENKLNMSFLEMSMGLRRRYTFKLKEGMYSDFFIHAGPNINYWLSGSGKIYNGDGGPEANYEVVFDQPADGNYNNMYFNGVNRWIFGIDLGIAANAPITSKQKIYVEFRATLGQTNLGGNSSDASINLIGFSGSDIQQNILKSNLKTYSISAAYTFSYNAMTARSGHSTKDKLVKRKKKSRNRSRRR